jgi:predicted nucleotidyltransferase
LIEFINNNYKDILSNYPEIKTMKKCLKEGILKHDRDVLKNLVIFFPEAIHHLPSEFNNRMKNNVKSAKFIIKIN